MLDQEKKNNSLNRSELELNKISNQKLSRASEFLHSLQSINGLHFFAALCQIFLGTSVVALSLISSIHPLWLATVMTVFGSINTMVGLYFMYTVLTDSGAFDSLLHKAIKRVINAQN